jgi:putative phosphoesterase
MRVAALYDIHGNLPALEAVLQAVRQAEVDTILVGGDVIPGPMPGETLTTLMNFPIPAHYIAGNGEREMLEYLGGTGQAQVSERLRDLLRWTEQQLQPNLDWVAAGWPKTVRIEIDGLGAVLFCHATPRDDFEIFTRLTPEERLLPVFEGLDVSTVVCGHTHMPFDRTVGTLRVVNAGSVGMPFGEPGADWLLLGPDVEFRHTAYDLNQAAERVRATGYPQAEDFASRDILQPHSAEEMLAHYAKHELK